MAIAKTPCGSWNSRNALSVGYRARIVQQAGKQSVDDGVEIDDAQADHDRAEDGCHLAQSRIAEVELETLSRPPPTAPPDSRDLNGELGDSARERRPSQDLETAVLDSEPRPHLVSND